MEQGLRKEVSKRFGEWAHVVQHPYFSTHHLAFSLGFLWCKLKHLWRPLITIFYIYIDNPNQRLVLSYTYLKFKVLDLSPILARSSQKVGETAGLHFKTELRLLLLIPKLVCRFIPNTIQTQIIPVRANILHTYNADIHYFPYITKECNPLLSGNLNTSVITVSLYIFVIIYTRYCRK